MYHVNAQSQCGIWTISPLKNHSGCSRGLSSPLHHRNLWPDFPGLRNSKAPPRPPQYPNNALNPKVAGLNRDLEYFGL